MHASFGLFTAKIWASMCEWKRRLIDVLFNVFREFYKHNVWIKKENGGYLTTYSPNSPNVYFDNRKHASTSCTSKNR